MSRPYDSSGRKRQALETRVRILDAAVALHARGITEVSALAEAAGVSVPTVRKHFPTKERIFEGCTQHFFGTFVMPDLHAADAMKDPSERILCVVKETSRAHESTHGLMWHAYPAADGSPALSAAIAAYAQIVESAVGAILDGHGFERAAALRPRLRALLDTLTYRALRIQARLDAESTRAELTALVAAALDVQIPVPGPSRKTSP